MRTFILMAAIAQGIKVRDIGDLDLPPIKDDHDDKAVA